MCTKGAPSGELFAASGRLEAAMVRRDRVALDARCPHRAGPLADGILADQSVICPLHERRFNLKTGREDKGELCVATHQVLVRGRDVFIRKPEVERDLAQTG